MIAAHPLGLDVAFTTPRGGTVVLRVESVTLRRDGELPPAVRIELLADEIAWARIDAGALLHLDPDARGPVLGDGFAGGEPVRIVALLDGLVMAALEPLDEAAIGARLRDGDPDDPLLDTESWWALDVTGRLQTPPGMDGEVRAGLTTVWPDASPSVGMATILATALEDEEIEASVEQSDDGTWIVHFGDAGASGYAIPRETISQAIVYLVLARPCPPDRREELARFVTLVNFGLPIGCLQADFESGQVRVCTSVDVADDRLSLAVARNLVGAARHLAGKWFGAVEQVMDGATAVSARSLR